MVFVATGFIDKKRLDVTIDMGTETAVHSVSADFMQVVGAEVFLPESVTISISDDGANFTELKQYTFEVNRKANKIEIKKAVEEIFSRSVRLMS